MSYSPSNSFCVNVSGMVSISAAPLDIATGYLPYTGRCFMPAVGFSMAEGTGIGPAGTVGFSFFTGYNGLGNLGTSTVGPNHLITTSGVDWVTSFAGGYPVYTFNSPYIVIRQTTNAQVTGVVNFQMNVCHVPN